MYFAKLSDVNSGGAGRAWISVSQSRARSLNAAEKKSDGCWKEEDEEEEMRLYGLTFAMGLFWAKIGLWLFTKGESLGDRTGLGWKGGSFLGQDDRAKVRKLRCSTHD